MGSAAREADMDIMTQKEHTDESTSPMALLPPETKMQIMSYISTQQSLSRLSQSCRAWYGPATQELYNRDAKEHTSFAVKWMAAHAVDEQTTDSALRTLEISRRWGGEIDAVKLDEAESDNEDQMIFDESTALHFAVLLGNIRLTETLLEMKASLAIPCSDLLWKSQSMVSEEVLRRVSYFLSVLGDYEDTVCRSAFPIFVAFIQRDADMCKFLVEHGASRTAMNVDFYRLPEPTVMSILHFAAADRTTDYRQWRCLFDGFREYIDEPCLRCKYTPLHVALQSGCTQGMQIAVESGADKEARDSAGRTPLSIGVLGIARGCLADSSTVEERTMCFRKFVKLGANINPEGDSVLVLAVQRYAYTPYPISQPFMRRLISFLLEHHADIHGTLGPQNTTALNEIINGILYYDQDPPIQELLKVLLSDLVDRGLNLTIPTPELPSPLYRVSCRKTNPEWLFDLLCEKGAIIHEYEVDEAFLRWCEIPRLWETNKYNAWWQHQGQEDEMFLKWCEDPYNAWWWQHVKHISPDAATQAYGAAFKHKDRQLYDILTHLPLPAPSDSLLVRVAFEAMWVWSWRLVVHRKFEDNFLATFSFDHGENSMFWQGLQGDNMIHLTVRKYVVESCYSAADAILDVLHLRDKGVNLSSPNSHGQIPLDLLLELGSWKNDFLELVALLEEKMGVQEVLQTTTLKLRKIKLF
ncbi:uncharacterized protein CPUR_05649 [Claviceps purpurea 20.1]|uniref:F-box domain-containing protein n=1 Tax=Claviceps purpurea (strain 20.1) TaxID=1111077 RepID=M1WGG8_CLAP2|nr:uncharacterized protein CPUR_05649 [Claviceps purpurea 20.1]